MINSNRIESFSISKKEVLKLLHSEINMVQKYATILDVDPEKSPFIQNLIKFLEIDDGPNVAKASESQPPQASESGKVKDSPTKHGASRVKGSVRTQGLDRRSPLNSVSIPRRIWQGFWKLLGF